MRYSALDRSLRDKEDANVASRLEDVKSLLQSMFDAGEFDIDISDDQLETMLPYFNQLEEITAQVTGKYFDGEIQYSLNTREQKSFDGWGENYQYICYVDVFVDGETPLIIETKATTTNKFHSLKYKEDGEDECIFLKKNNVYYLKEDILEKDYSEKYFKQREKLFNRFHDAGKYVFDLAVQRWIVERSSKEKYRYLLAVLNHQYVFDGRQKDGKPDYSEIDGQDLVSFIDLTKITEEYQPQIDAMARQVEYYQDELNIDEVDLGPYCERKKTTQCKFYDICWKKVPSKDSIFTYIDNHHGFKDGDKKRIPMDLINEGYTKFDDIPSSWLNREKNQIQRSVFESGKEFLSPDKLKAGLDCIEFPIYHLDFESFPCPLPRYKGEKPYSQSVFQYSLHIQRDYFDCDKEKDHYEFLADGFNDQRRELVESMIKNLGDKGSILVWNQGFEKGRIKEFIGFFPEYTKELEAINNRIFDLMYILKSNSKLYTAMGFDKDYSKIFNYYHKDLQGSFSIKKVLPLFSELTYQGMEVGNGMEAVVAFANLHKLDDFAYKHKYNALLEYCKQDTWAMVEITNGIKEMVDVL